MRSEKLISCQRSISSFDFLFLTSNRSMWCDRNEWQIKQEQEIWQWQSNGPQKATWNGETEITLPKREKSGVIDGRAIAHIVKYKERKNNVYFPPLHPPICLPTQLLLLRRRRIHQSVEFLVLLPNRDPIFHISFFPSCTLWPLVFLFVANSNVKQNFFDVMFATFFSQYDAFCINHPIMKLQNIIVLADIECVINIKGRPITIAYMASSNIHEWT